MSMKIGSRDFDTKRKIYLMGILNLTPDSFSDGGKYTRIEEALFHTEEMVKEGADLIDIGGESTRPGSIPVSTEEELYRVIPVIEAVKQRFDIPLSLDTYKAVVAKEGIAAGVDLINDIWGLQYEEEMAKVIAEAQVSCCLMHNRKKAEYEDYFFDIMADFSRILETAHKAGIKTEKIILDPGIGFAKDTKQNLQLTAGLNKLMELGYPLLLGVSRKSMIGETLNLPVDQRLYGTIAVNIYGAMQGCSFLRVHDIRPHKEAIKMLEAIRSMESK